MLKYQMYVFLPVILLPIFITLLFHPSTSVKKIFKAIIIISLIYVSSALPIIILVELKYWILLLLILPIIFRTFEVIINKLDIINHLKNSNKININYIFHGSIGGFVILLSSAELGKWLGENSNLAISCGAWLAIIVFIFVSTDILNLLNKKMSYGVIFGIMSLIIGPILKNETGIATYMFSWLIYLVPSLCIPLLRRSRLTDMITLIFVPTTTFLLLGQGGIPFSWDYRCYSIITLIFINLMLISIHYQVNKYTISPAIKQYSLPIFLSIITIILIFFSNRYTALNKILIIVISPTVIETVIVNLGRFVLPIYTNSKTRTNLFTDEDIKKIVVFLFGEVIGQFIFNIILGENYNKVKKIHIIIGSIVSVLVPLIGILLIKQVATITEFFIYICELKSSFLLLVILFMTISGLVLLNDISELLNQDIQGKGLKHDIALKSSASISVNYLFLIIYYLILNLTLISSINIGIIVLAIIWMLLASLSLHFGLCEDLTKINYNQLKNVRHFISVILFGITYFIIFYLSITNSINLSSSDSFNKLFNKVYYLVVASAILCKLVGFDTAIASHKLRKKFIREAIINPIIIILIGIPFGIIKAYVILTNGDINNFSSVYNFILIFLLLCFVRTLVLAVLPATNNINQSLYDYLLFKTRWKKNKVLHIKKHKKNCIHKNVNGKK